MGGPTSPQEIMSFPYELSISQLKVEFRSNVIPIGSITSGIQVHRALLFKVCLLSPIHSFYNASFSFWPISCAYPQIFIGVTTIDPGMKCGLMKTKG